MSKKGLGRGLSALITSNSIDNDENKTKFVELNIASISSNKNQPRKYFNEEKLAELAESIKENGVVQPIVVRDLKDGTFEIVAGERRWRACKKLGLATIPAIIKEYKPSELTAIALIENLQRENLNPIEEAQAYKKLLEDCGLTQDQLSVKIGKSRPFIANMCRLLNLPLKIQIYLSEGKLTAGHARALLALEEEAKQIFLAEQIITKHLSVRQIEELIKKQQKETAAAAEEDNVVGEGNFQPIFSDMEERMRSIFGTQVRIKNKSKGKGKIEIEYYSETDLERILEIMSQPGDY